MTFSMKSSMNFDFSWFGFCSLVENALMHVNMIGGSNEVPVISKSMLKTVWISSKMQCEMWGTSQTKNSLKKFQY